MYVFFIEFPNSPTVGLIETDFSTDDNMPGERPRE